MNCPMLYCSFLALVFSVVQKGSFGIKKAATFLSEIVKRMDPKVLSTGFYSDYLALCGIVQFQLEYGDNQAGPGHGLL